MFTSIAEMWSTRSAWGTISLVAALRTSLRPLLSLPARHFSTSSTSSCTFSGWAMSSAALRGGQQAGLKQPRVAHTLTQWLPVQQEYGYFKKVEGQVRERLCGSPLSAQRLLELVCRGRHVFAVESICAVNSDIPTLSHAGGMIRHRESCLRRTANHRGTKTGTPGEKGPKSPMMKLTGSAWVNLGSIRTSSFSAMNSSSSDENAA